MRTIITLAVLLVFAAPAALSAQSASDFATPDGDARAELVQQQTAEAEAERDLTNVEAQVVEASQQHDAPQAVQQPNRQWWWLVGAIVLGGILLAVLGVF